MRPTHVVILLLLVLATGVGCSASPPRSPEAAVDIAGKSPGEALREAARRFQDRDPDGCLAICNALLSTQLRPIHEAWARYYAAEALFQMQEYYRAHLHYEVLIAYFPGFSELRRCIDREYAIGCAFVDGRQERPFLGLSISARDLGYEMLNVLLERFEDAAFDYGRFLMGEYQFEEEAYPRAIVNYQRLIREYPASEWVDLAYYRVAQSTLLLADGYDYDVTQVLRAEQLLVDYLRRFPRGNKVNEAEALLDEVRTRLARRNLQIASYYADRADEPLAATIYYANILRRYPDTEEADEAVERLKLLSRRHPGEVEQEARRVLPLVGEQ